MPPAGDFAHHAGLLPSPLQRADHSVRPREARAATSRTRHRFRTRAAQRPSHRECVELPRCRPGAPDSGRRGRVGCSASVPPLKSSSAWRLSICGRASTASTACARSPGPGSAKRPSIPVHEPVADTPQSFGVGWQRVVALRQAAGTRPIRVARGEGRAQRHHACGRVGDAGERNGSRAGASAQELAAADPGGINFPEHFHAFV